ncbi:Peroxidase [Pleurostoma richardsiae]|uniref:Peroxidase n=1 Tax=Pleurostoma richardsiae TaxID=41990 RepID=A0AA38RRW8_9PEZI|nr:Peroxidase [Pleurostoma richardsiae]
MLAVSVPLLLSLSLAPSPAAADPTWPSPIDEVEEIMFQMKDFKTRNFADTILPCTNEASGPGRQNAAEWLRVGFHDMATANASAGLGGLDGSIQYQLVNGENLGPGFETTLRFMSTFLTPRSSLADLIAVGVYASVRSCGGPVVPIRAGRVDAAAAGPMGVPQPEHSVEQLREAFLRMGFTNAEMIEATACGHTIGGVHDTEFPELVAAGEAPSDSTVAVFDERVVTEYLSGETANPLVVGPAVALGKDSDTKVFASDGNATVRAMAAPEAFQDACRRVLQKMIEVVPAGVRLSEEIRPYAVKPTEMQLTLSRGAHSMIFTGFIRVRTTEMPPEEILNVTLVYKDRNGGNQCGSGRCAIVSTLQGVGYGLDDSFGFFPVEAQIPASSGISSFVLHLNLVNGTSLLYDNNGLSYPMQDAVMILRPHSCLVQHTGETRVLAAVRNDRAGLPATLAISYRAPREGLPVAGLHNMTMSMRKGECMGPYTLFEAAWTIPGGESFASRIDIISGEGGDVVVDDFNRAVDLPGYCEPFDGPAAACASVAVLLSTSAAGVSVSTATESSTAVQVLSSTAVPTMTTSTILSPVSTPVSGATGRPSPPTEDEEIMEEVGEYQTVKGFAQYWVNYFVNFFFGYDRFQVVNNELDRVT